MNTEGIPERIPDETTLPESIDWTPPPALGAVILRRALVGLPVLLGAWVVLLLLLVSIARAGR